MLFKFANLAEFNTPPKLMIIYKNVHRFNENAKLNIIYKAAKWFKNAKLISFTVHVYKHAVRQSIYFDKLGCICEYILK